MKKIFLITIVLVILNACNVKHNPITNNDGETTEIPTEKQLKLNIADVVLLDSSSIVMFPLLLNANTRKDAKYSSSYGGDANAYWNIIFYNTEDRTYHLLDERKMVIYNYTYKNYYGSSSSDNNNFNSYSKIDNFIFYNVMVTDYNKDGKLDDLDPNYLFISDKNGNNFKQISPNNISVNNWQIVKKTNKILLEVVIDSNNDKLFNSKDEIVQMVYDFNKDVFAEPIFEQDFKLKLEKKLNKQWKLKE